MAAKLPLINLSSILSEGSASELKRALHQFGAFRLAAPEVTHHRHDAVIKNAGQAHVSIIVFVTDRTLRHWSSSDSLGRLR